MALSNDLASQFAKSVVKTEDKSDKGAVVNGTYKIINNKEYVQLDGSDIYTPVKSLVEAEDGERVKVEVKNHNATVTGNISSPMARSKSIKDIKDTVDEFGNTIKQMDNTIEQQNNSIEQFDNDIKQAQNDILQFNNQINQQNNKIQEFDDTIKSQGNTIDSMNNTITEYGDQIESMNNTIEAQSNDIKSFNNNITEINDKITSQGNTIEAQGNQIEQFGNEISQQKNVIEQQGNTIQEHDSTIRAMDSDLDALRSKVEIHDSDITVLNSAFTIKDGVVEGLDAIIVNQLMTTVLDTHYAKIDFTNIGIAAIEKLFADSGIIDNLVVKDQHITGKLVGVTIVGDLIEAGTLKADKLVIQGKDGLYYKLNVEALGKVTADSDPIYQKQLTGSALVAHSVTAEKITVDDLVAFNATIGGFTIEKDSIHTNEKGLVARNYFSGYSNIDLDTAGSQVIYEKTGYGRYRITSTVNHTNSALTQHWIMVPIDDPEKLLGHKLKLTVDLEASDNNLYLSTKFYYKKGTTYGPSFEPQLTSNATKGKVTKTGTTAALPTAFPEGCDGLYIVFWTTSKDASTTFTSGAYGEISNIKVEVVDSNETQISDANGVYMDNRSQFYIGDINNHVKYYIDDDHYVLDITAAQIRFSNEGATIQETLTAHEEKSSELANSITETNNNLNDAKTELSNDLNKAKDDLNNSIEDVSNTLTSETNRLDKNISTNTMAIEALESNMSLTFKSTGGNNLIRNSVGYKGTSFWTVKSGLANISTEHNEAASISGNSFKFTGPVVMEQEFNTITRQKYSVSFKLKHSVVGDAGKFKMELIGEKSTVATLCDTNTTYTSWQSFGLAEPYEASITNPILRITITDPVGADVFELTDLFIACGEVEIWTQHASEMYGVKDLLDEEGLRLFDLNTGDYTHVTSTDVTIKSGVDDIEEVANADDPNIGTVDAQLNKNHVYTDYGEFKSKMSVATLETIAIDADNIIEYISST